MLRKLIIFGVCAGASASVPMLWDKDGEKFKALTEMAAGSDTPAPKPIAVSAATASTAGRSVTIDADMRGHFTASFKINGRSIDAMVDTGATLVAINVSTARKAGVKVAPADFTQKVNTANGAARAALARIDRLQIGRISVDDVPVVVLEDKALDGTLIGMSFLSRLKKYQVENGALLLVQ
ncbi:TIGR02281 family clan AA aspartic protease [Aminobacter anthyllidis]|uniref:TIGR02281 family clan AA aspartic protease n=1 Tax=Aminobacter anthyllidis TaxID=1035067 RepID=A0A9X1D7T4_9HYPH|nr:TIGR02281 family clan AA aspartic protease [Aminobacter anthyllidis]MBT1158239.1 TIGR02281 family clan AA aspartic protease [Aminobacter anthyllidis]